MEPIAITEIKNNRSILHNVLAEIHIITEEICIPGYVISQLTASFFILNCAVFTPPATKARCMIFLSITFYSL